MENIDPIIKQRLQDKIKVVLQEYQSGKIRAEVKKELEQQKIDEEIRRLAEKEGYSDFRNKLRRFWLELSYNETYYEALKEIGGNKVCDDTRGRMASCLFSILFLIAIAGCYLCGGIAENIARAYHTEISAALASASGPLSPSIYTDQPWSLIFAYALLICTPVVLSMLLAFVTRRLSIVAFLFTGACAVHYWLTLATEFSGNVHFQTSLCILFGIMMGIVFSVVVLPLVVLICRNVYKF